MADDQGEGPVRELDQSKPYGYVTPPHFGASFKQDGVYFDGNGRYMPEHPDNVAFMEAGGKPSEAEQGVVPQNQVEDDGHVNLTAWLKGERYPWFSVQAAIQKRFNAKVTKKVDAIDLLIDKGVCPPEQVTIDDRQGGLTNNDV